MAKGIGQDNIAQEFMIGNTHIKICDEHCRNMSEEAVEDVLLRIAERALPYLIAQKAINLKNEN